MLFKELKELFIAELILNIYTLSLLTVVKIIGIVIYGTKL